MKKRYVRQALSCEIKGTGLYYYVDPGSGFVFAQNASFVWAIILGFLGSLFLFLRLFFKIFRKLFWILIILSILFIAGGLMAFKGGVKNKVIILGIDAMDPYVVEELMSEGKLPNLSYLKAQGTYSHLGTTIPSDSVVAWTSFATGLNPADHGIFDFVMRDPRNYNLYLSLNEISSDKGKPQIKIRRSGETLWKNLSKNKIPSLIYFCPNTFPPDIILGKMISGMGVPDITGTMGRFSFYASRALSKDDQDSRGKIIQVKFVNNVAETELFGPKTGSAGLVTDSTVPLKISISPEKNKISLAFQGNQISLEQGRWTQWQRIKFKIGFFRTVKGIIKFYLDSTKPDFNLYASPVNFDPQQPIFPISYPKDYSSQLAKRIGLYHTQGMPYDTWALTEGRIDEKAFLELVDEIINENEHILDEGLREFRGGVLFFYFGFLDAIQHMFWRYRDIKHPVYEANLLYKDIIYKYYEKTDQILGHILKHIDPQTTLIVLSDHGFSSFRRAVNLNRWLLENGYLVLKNGNRESREFFEDVDWPKTKAYALGFGGIYFNIIGREYYGVVSGFEVDELKRKMIQELKQFKDSQTGENVIKNVYTQEETFQGLFMNEAPDLFVGFNAGYRASWQNALGGVPNVLIEDNKRKWSGDHLIDPSLVPGVLFVNKKNFTKNPSIADIACLVLGLFGISQPEKNQ